MYIVQSKVIGLFYQVLEQAVREYIFYLNSFLCVYIFTQTQLAPKLDRKILQGIFCILPTLVNHRELLVQVSFRALQLH